jgi:hypothetical protein
MTYAFNLIFGILLLVISPLTWMSYKDFWLSFTIFMAGLNIISLVHELKKGSHNTEKKK